MIGWWKSSEADQFLPIPWLHPAAVLYMETLINKFSFVIEHGCGGSSLWFAERCNYVKSYDDNPKWMAEVRKRAPSNLEVLDEVEPTNLNLQCDLMLIDGNVKTRARWIKAARKLVKPGGVVVLDNANRDEYKDQRQYLQSIAAHHMMIDGNPPRHIHACTEFYLMPGGLKGWV